MNKEYLEWVKYAENDLLTAETMSEIINPPLEVVCYHCQQAAEKLLKAFLILNDEQVIKTHDLVFLNSKCMKFDENFKSINKHCIRLTNYGVNTRYPNVMDLMEIDMEIALKDVLQVKAFIIEKLQRLEEQ